MDEKEFDGFADEYRAVHAANIAVSGEAPEFFAEYKIADTRRLAREAGIAPARILDFGCGVGASIAFLHRYFPDSRIVGADVSRKSLDLARQRFGAQAEFLAIGTSSIDLPDESVDLLFSACVFHHIPHDEHVQWLRELRRVARPGALLVVFEHNPWNPLTVRTVNACPFDANARLLTPRVLRARVRRAGWHSTAREYRMFFPRALARLRGIEPGLRWLPLGAQYSVSARA
jgi:ubiquinone/menaquinone biosynthesis C-methylase UbiE